MMCGRDEMSKRWQRSNGVMERRRRRSTKWCLKLSQCCGRPIVCSHVSQIHVEVMEGGCLGVFDLLGVLGGFGGFWGVLGGFGGILEKRKINRETKGRDKNKPEFFNGNSELPFMHG